MKKSIQVLITFAVSVVAMAHVATAEDFPGVMKEDVAKHNQLFGEIEDVALILEVNETDPDADIGEFEDPHLVVVWSVSDEDAQIIGGGGSEAGIKRVLILGPNARVVHLTCFKDGNELGQADFQFDTPEPSLEELMRAYPPGEYRFWGRTIEGENLASTVELSYDLLNPPDIHYPQDGDTNIPVEDLIVRFSAPEDAQAIRLEIEDEEAAVAMKVDLPGDASQFNVPNAWLRPGVEYVLDIKVIAENGNQTVRDIRFVTRE